MQIISTHYWLLLAAGWQLIDAAGFPTSKHEGWRKSSSSSSFLTSPHLSAAADGQNLLHLAASNNIKSKQKRTQSLSSSCRRFCQPSACFELKSYWRRELFGIAVVTPPLLSAEDEAVELGWVEEHPGTSSLGGLPGVSGAAARQEEQRLLRSWVAGRNRLDAAARHTRWEQEGFRGEGAAESPRGGDSSCVGLLTVDVCVVWNEFIPFIQGWL